MATALGGIFETMTENNLSMNGVLIHIAPAIPDRCLNSFAGWLLRAKLDSKQEITDGVPCTHFCTEGDETDGQTIDDEFIRYFEATPDDDRLKQQFLEENEDLADEGSLVVGNWVSTFLTDLDDVIQRIVRDSQGLLPEVEVTFFYEDECSGTSVIRGCCSFITEKSTAFISIEDWFHEQRALSGVENTRHEPR